MSAPAFRKERSGAPADYFRAEAHGLRWLGEATAAGGARVAQPVAVGDDFIEVERIEPVEPSVSAAEAFGAALARTHAAGAAGFGAPPAGWSGGTYIGRLGLPQGDFGSWGLFYGQLRVLPYADRALKAGRLSREGHSAIRALVDRLAAGEFDDERPPARIHGDLWTGNVLFGHDGVVLIDPAAHGGHGETDLAMLALFNAPHLERIFDAYAEAALLDPQWRERIGIHQLHPLLVHAITHDAWFGEIAARVAGRYR